MKRFLKLQHRKHSGRLIHHRHTSYRALIAIVLLAGIVVILTSRVAAADDIVITATVPAPIPTVAPIISTPQPGNSSKSPQIIVRGSCPTISPPIVIALFDNGSFVGSAPCINGSFSLGVSLATGANSLVATVETITGGTGKSSSSVVVTYSALGGAVLPAKQKSTPPRMSFVEHNLLLTFGPNKDATISGSISGGTPPFTLTVDWGDLSHQTLTASTHTITASHHYAESRVYAVRLDIADVFGAVTAFQTAAVTFATAPAPANSTNTPPGNFFPIFSALTLPGSPVVTATGYTLLLVLVGGLWYLERLTTRTSMRSITTAAVKHR